MLGSRWIVLALLPALLSAGPLGVSATEYHFNPNSGSGNDWWMTAANWTPTGVPNSADDIAVFDVPATAGNLSSTNVHDLYFKVQELRFALAGNWNIHNARQDPTLESSSGTARITQNGSGAVTFNTDLVLNSTTVFGGSGTGSITVNGSGDGSDLYKETVRGAGGLTLDGNYTLALNAPLSYAGATTVNAGTLLLNGDSKAPVYSGNTVIGYTPVTLQPITVNGGTLGGTGNLLADVTVRSGATFAPGSTSAASPQTMSLNNLTLQTGSSTAIDLAGATPGSGTGYYDRVHVNQQLSLGGALSVGLATGYAPAKSTSYTIFTYGSLNAAARTFDTVALPTVPTAHPNWTWNVDYGTGTSSQVTVNFENNPWYFTGGAYDPSYVSPNPTLEPANNAWWAIRANWNYNGKPGTDAAFPDVVIFDDAHYSAYAPAQRQTNIHDAGPGYLQELQVNTSSSTGWHFYNNNRTLAMKNATTGQPALITQNGSGPIRMDVNLRLDSDTVFGGTGAGAVTINGSLMQATGAGMFARLGVYGDGGLTLNGHYTVTINNVANYQGTTTINDGATLLFNAETATVNPDWVYGDPSTYYRASTQGAVTVQAGGTLGGTGKLHAPVTVLAGGFLAPGASPGVFTVDSLTLDPGSTTLMELGGATAGNGAGFHDQIVVIDLLSLGGTLDFSLLNGFEPTLGQSFVLFRYGTLDPEHATFDSLVAPTGSWGAFVLDYGTGSNSQITVTAMLVPEPTTLGLLVLGTVAFVGRRVGRRNKTRPV